MPIRPTYHRFPFQPAPAPERRESAAVRGYDRAWARLRKQYLTEHPLCVFQHHPYAQGRCEQVAVEVDHVTPIGSGGGRLDVTNLRAVCRSCHSRITANYRMNGLNELPAPRHLAIGFFG